MLTIPRFLNCLYVVILREKYLSFFTIECLECDTTSAHNILHSSVELLHRKQKATMVFSALKILSMCLISGTPLALDSRYPKLDSFPIQPTLSVIPSTLDAPV